MATPGALSTNGIRVWCAFSMWPWPRTPSSIKDSPWAAVTAIQRVRSDSTASTALAGSSSVSGEGSAQRTVAPAKAG